IELIRNWIDQGANYESHWAFIPPRRPELPEPDDDQRVRNTIDRFIQAELTKRDLSLAPEADRETLIRRVTLDLTGLPPTIEAIDAFLADDSDEAYERLVDRLLSRGAYGERLASDWLDVARYSDTYGFQVDRDRFVWPWRDWVIQACNENMPYDQFITEQLAEGPDPHVETRIAQYELAFRMQNSIPEATDFADEPESVLELYGPDARNPGTFAANCLQARRLIERGVRFVQLYHQGWDHHGGLPSGLPRQCAATDQASAALVTDLKRCGLLEDTLVVWGGEFGRTNYCQGKLTPTSFGRDHHPRCFSIWMAGGGIKPGISYGQTDEYGYNVTENPLHVHDLQATILHQLGIDHERLTYKYQGRQFRLTDVHGQVVHQILS
ncbi:MAG: DUF1501 domain-containing protein, partial [Novipirellula sp. JB048]